MKVSDQPKEHYLAVIEIIEDYLKCMKRSVILLISILILIFNLHNSCLQHV